MEVSAELLLKLLGLGFLVTFISRVELADKIYQISRGFSQWWADIFSVLVIVIIVYAASALENH